MLTGVGGVVVALALFFTVLKVMGTKAISSTTVTAATFDVGSAKQRAQAIARDRTPLLFQDPLGDGGDLYVQRFGDRWIAFDARAPGAPARCVLRWEVKTQDFTDPCSGTIYPPDGTGLVTYPTKVEKARLLVDLRSPQPPVPPSSVAPE